MAARYQIRVKDKTGTLTAVLVDFVSCDWAHRVNAAGALTLVLDSTPTRVTYFERDGQIELWRSDPDQDIDWYCEWEGLITGIGRATLKDGRKHLTVRASGYVDLLARRIVGYPADTAGAHKTGTASTVMRAYVNENAGPSATLANGRLSAGVVPGLALGTDPAAGGSWDGARAHKNLLDVLQGIADEAGIDFDVIGMGAATYEFRVYSGQRGTNRTTQGLDRTTGLNTAGYAPVVFSTLLGNMGEPAYSENWGGYTNCVYVLGQGDGPSRWCAVRPDGADVAATPVALRELMRNAANEAGLGPLQVIGDAVLAARQPLESFTFSVLQVPGCLYHKHYTWGDKITARYEEIERHKRIVGMRGRMAGGADGGETLSAEIADVP